MENAKIIDIDQFGINEVNVTLVFNGKKYCGCITELDSEDKSNKFFCNKCNKEFEDLNDLEYEELINEGSFVCSECINKEMNDDKN